MHDEDRFEFDTRENRFFSQLPSVLLAAAAVGMIVLVNSGGLPSASAPHRLPTGAERSGAPTIEAVPAQGKPAARAAADDKALPPTAAGRA